jgi:hypothetical protein
MRMRERGIGIVLVLFVLGGCATAPTGPSVMVLPPAGKPFEQFQAEDAKCRQWARQQSNLASYNYESEAQRTYDIAYQQCMYAYGNIIPGIRYTRPARQMPLPPNLESAPQEYPTPSTAP